MTAEAGSNSSSVAVTIAMRTFQRPVLLRRAIEDVLAQTFDDWHLSIVNNAGPVEEVDGLVDEYAERFAGRVTVSHLPTQVNMEHGTNTAFASAQGDAAGRYLVVHDDDDTWSPEFLTRTVARLDDAGPDVAGVAVRSDYVLERIDGDGIVELERRPHNPNLSVVSPADVLAANPFPPISFLLRRSVFDELGGLDERFTFVGDWDLVIRILHRHRIDVIPETLAGYHHRDDNATDANSNSVSRVAEMAANEAQLREKIIREALAAGEIGYGEILTGISPVDRDTLALAKDLRERAIELQLLAGDIDERLKHIHGFVQKHDVDFARFEESLARLTRWLARMDNMRMKFWRDRD